MRKKLKKLIDVKSIVTLALIFVMCYMTVTGKPMSQLFENSVLLVLGFYFGKGFNSDNVPEKLSDRKDDAM